MRSYWDYFDDIEKKFKTLNLEVNTPIVAITIDGKNVFIKDENKNLNKSFKDRGLSYQMVRNIQQGETKFALSSSGNSAISAGFVSQHYDAELQLFLSNKINQTKLDRLKEFTDSKIRINLSDKPRSELIKFLNNNPDYVNLRGSTDVYASSGFKTISHELVNQVPDIDAIFIPCSSGTSTVGIYEGFKELNRNVSIHICQTEKIHPISKYFDLDFVRNETSIADAISDRVAHRKSIVIEIIKQTSGFGWIISDSRLLKESEKLFNLLKVDHSYNSILAYSGWRKALEKGYNYKNPVLLFSGL